MVGREKRGGKNHKEDRLGKASRRNEWGGGGGADGGPGHNVRAPSGGFVASFSSGPTGESDQFRGNLIYSMRTDWSWH